MLGILRAAACCFGLVFGDILLGDAQNDTCQIFGRRLGPPGAH
jgi:hypothetical protein